MDKICQYCQALKFRNKPLDFLMFIPASSIKLLPTGCSAPPQPENGYWYLDKYQCSLLEGNCDVQEGQILPPSSILIYNCFPGYEVSQPNYTLCLEKEEWLKIPVCTDIRCEPLASASTNADCTLNGQRVSCESPVLFGTTAKLSCRDNYQEIENSQSEQVDQVICNNKGKWEPEPMRCIKNTVSYNTNILVKKGTLKFQIIIERINPLCELLKVLPDKIIITYKMDACNSNNSYIDVR